MITPYELLCNRVPTPMGIRNTPTFSWKLHAAERNQQQSAYRICAASKPDLLEAPDLYDSGKIFSSNTLDVAWNGSALRSFQRIWWQVTVWDQDNTPSTSEVTWFESGIKEADFAACSIHAGDKPDPIPTKTSFATTAPALDRPALPGPPPAEGPEEFVGGPPGPPMMPSKPEVYFRREFFVQTTISRSRFYLMASGPCLVRLDGHAAGEWLNDPSPNGCSYRPLYTIYDLTEQLAPGKHAIGISTIGSNITALVYLEYENGEQEWIRADSSWKWAYGPTQRQGEGEERYDARLELVGWDTVAYPDASWQSASIAPDPYTLPYPNLMPVQKVTWREHPQDWHLTEWGTWYGTSSILTAGRIHFRLRAPADTQIQIHMSEKPMVLGEVQRITDPLGNPEEGGSDTCTYIFSGNGVEEWAQRYSFSGISHLEISGYPGEISPEDIWFEAVLNDAKTISTMDCAEPMFTQLHEMLIRTIRNNFHGVLTTCPPYEKGPADGDTQITLPSFLWNLDCLPILSRLDDDFAASIRQRISYTLEDLQENRIAPGMIRTVPEWSCMLVSHCLELWDLAGLREEAEQYYPELQRYIQNELAELHYGNYIVDSFFGGDWNSPKGNGAPEGGTITGTSYACRTLRQLQELCQRLGHSSEAAYYGTEADYVQAALNRAFLKDDCYETHVTTYFPQWGPPPWDGDDKAALPVGYRQTSSLVPLALNLVPKEQRSKVLSRLVEEIHKNGDHLDTGFLGAKHLLMTISDAGYIDLAYEIATKRDYPSWGYWLEQGATTCWEHWGSFARSRDHYFLAAGLEDWFREALGGIRDVQNAYAQFVIRPQIPKKLQHFSISSNTPRGIVSSGWKKTAEGLTMKLEIPVGSTAMVYPPITGEQTVLLDGQALPSTAFQLGSGAYTIYIQN